jgi:hypothetical protein
LQQEFSIPEDLPKLGTKLGKRGWEGKKKAVEDTWRPELVIVGGALIRDMRKLILSFTG